jgi:hypothetical protein
MTTLQMLDVIQPITAIRILDTIVYKYNEYGGIAVCSIKLYKKQHKLNIENIPIVTLDKKSLDGCLISHCISGSILFEDLLKDKNQLQTLFLERKRLSETSQQSDNNDIIF